MAAVSELPTAGPAPLAGLLARREVGVCGTRFTAVLDGCEIGLIEVATDLTSGGVRSRYAGWADIGNLHVSEHHRRLGVGTWLVAGAAAWLRLGRVERVVDYADPDRADLAGFLARIGFHELTRNARRWERPAR